MTAVRTATGGQSRFAVNDLGLYRRNTQRDKRGLRIDQRKGFAAIERGVDACITGCVNRAARPSSCHVINSPADTFENLPMCATICATRQTVTTICEKLSWSSRNGEQPKNIAKG